MDMKTRNHTDIHCESKQVSPPGEYAPVPLVTSKQVSPLGECTPVPWSLVPSHSERPHRCSRDSLQGSVYILNPMKLTSQLIQISTWVPNEGWREQGMVYSPKHHQWIPLNLASFLGDCLCVTL